MQNFSSRYLLLKRLADRFDDADIGATATQVAAHALFDFRLGKLDVGCGDIVRHGARHTLFVFLHHADGRADVTGRAIAALETVVFDKGGLQRVQLIASGDPLNGRNLSALILHGERETRVDTLTVNQHGARTARALIAAFLRATQPEVFVERVE